MFLWRRLGISSNAPGHYSGRLMIICGRSLRQGARELAGALGATFAPSFGLGIFWQYRPNAHRAPLLCARRCGMRFAGILVIFSEQIRWGKDLLGKVLQQTVCTQSAITARLRLGPNRGAHAV
jgi:hypothetical protein